jgi:hypothetical protein
MQGVHVTCLEWKPAMLPHFFGEKQNSLPPVNWRWVEEGDGYVGRLQPPGQPLGVGLPSGLQCLVPYPYLKHQAIGRMPASVAFITQQHVCSIMCMAAHLTGRVNGHSWVKHPQLGQLSCSGMALPWHDVLAAQCRLPSDQRTL